MAALAWLALACSADTGDGSGRSGTRGGANGGGAGATGAGAGGGGGSFGNSNAPTGGTTGGTNNMVVGPGGDECPADSAEAEVGREPADIVWVVDNSCSMAVESAAVQTNMNRFAQKLIDSGIDVHLVLISSAKVPTAMQVACAPTDIFCLISQLMMGFDFGICIDAPFGSGMCPADSKPPNFLHLPISVGSTNGLQLMVDNYPMYKSMMRPNASKHFAIVTDDNSDMTAAAFTTAVSSFDPDPALFGRWFFHGIFSFTQCPDAAKIGTVYQELVPQTGGVAADLCMQQFDPVFDTLAMDVVTKAVVACDWPIPPAPAGQTLDPSLINVRFTQPDGTVVNLGKIPDGEGCGDREGWDYDDAVPPTKVLACPASCDIFRNGGGKVDVLFGCETIVVQ